MKKPQKDLFSKLVNWLSEFGQDRPAIYRKEGSQDLFSRLMNRISN